MKKELKSADRNNFDNSLILKFTKSEVLSSVAMNSIRGGDNEDDGGGTIIIIITKPK